MATIDWTSVEEAEKENTASAHKLAVLEAAKLFEGRMSEEHIPGHTPAERLEAVKLHLTRPADVTKAYAFVERLRHGSTGALTKSRAKDYLQAFRQGVADLNDLTRQRDSFGAQVKLYWGLVRARQRWLVRALIGLGGFFLLVLFLDGTGFGRAIVGGVVSIVHGFFSWIAILLVSLAAVLLAVIGTAVYLDRRGGTVRGEDE
ncbi:MAG: hypothetical protein Q8Q11_01020 [bacterium]|nr:hypothetical protein [bacterium]MDZ4247929.1 hypothetical protein [Patescibacteria group bacterium]